MLLALQFSNSGAEYFALTCAERTLALGSVNTSEYSVMGSLTSRRISLMLKTCKMKDGGGDHSEEQMNTKLHAITIKTRKKKGRR